MISIHSEYPKPEIFQSYWLLRIWPTWKGQIQESLQFTQWHERWLNLFNLTQKSTGLINTQVTKENTDNLHSSTLLDSSYFLLCYLLALLVLILLGDACLFFCFWKLSSQMYIPFILFQTIIDYKLNIVCLSLLINFIIKWKFRPLYQAHKRRNY